MRLWQSIILPIALSTAAWSAPSPVVPNPDGVAVSAEKADKIAPEDPSNSDPQPTTVLLVASGLICFGMTRKFRVNR